MIAITPTWSVPTQDDLPCDDGIPMETQRHKLQMDLLMDGLTTWLDQREGGYVSGNMFIYFSLEQVRNQDFRGPDVFVVLDVPKKERKSWVVWEEGKAPDIVIELLSESTINLDKGLKKQIYQNQMRVSEYYWYDPFNPADWAGFVLTHGIYQPMTPNAQGYLESPCTGLVLRQWLGDYRGVHTTWLRWANPDGQVLPNAQELAQQAQQEAQMAQQRAELAEQEARIAQQRADLAEQRAARLAQKLQELGIDPKQFQ
jgi:Uma2 family endonuclease